ncbi:Glycosyltransferase [Rhynchospora pubera]|uniref:Glycosyltransferase n=1 Tax=Rhynchospora pubera TaxID=906938 RepID=A0AAV8C8A4_9POAL|nr:Glycosyltransferase [Rhynchospora pubera]
MSTAKQAPTSASPHRHRIIFFPLPAPGHVIPMVDMAKIFTKHVAECTLILTPLYTSRFESTINRSGLRLITFKFPSETGLPAEAVVSDAILPWTAIASAKLNIPRYLCPGISCFALSVERFILFNRPQQNVTSESDPFLIPELPDQIYLTKSQLVQTTLPDGNLSELYMRVHVQEAEKVTAGYVVNTFYELESTYIKHCERDIGKPIFHVGPVCLGGPVMVTQLGFGLIDSGAPFIWSVGGGDGSDEVANEVASPAPETGNVIRGWAPQFAILGRVAVGTFLTHFLTHCGLGAATEACGASGRHRRADECRDGICMGRGGENRGFVEQRESSRESPVGPRGRCRGNEEKSMGYWTGGETLRRERRIVVCMCGEYDG